MKKLLAILALFLFLGGTAVPALAAGFGLDTAIELTDEDPKKKTEKKAGNDECADTKKSEAKDCQQSEKAAKSAKANKKSDCSKTCSGGT